MHASLIDRVRPELVRAALSVSEGPPQGETVETALDEAEALGLLGSRSRSSSSGRRIHPLFRDFLRLHLEQEASPDLIRAMHGAVADAAEPTDWLVSARHFALAGNPADAMRVLGSAASAALGTGAWGAAVEIIDLMPDAAPPAAVKVIQARALVSDGVPDDALALLANIDRGGLSPEERGLVGLTRAAVHHMNGNGPAVVAEIEAVASDDTVPSPLHEVALSWRQILLASAGGCITDSVQMLRRLAVSQRQAGLHYFAGVTLHNLAYSELARGNYSRAHEIALDAAAHLDQSDDTTGIAASTGAILSAAVAELGRLEEGLRTSAALAGEPGATADAIADAAYLHAVCGRSTKARSLLARFDRGDAPWSRELGSIAQGHYARISLALAEGRLGEAEKSLRALQALESPGIDARSRTAIVVATLSLATGREDATRHVQVALESVAAQNAWRWMSRARMLEAIASRDGVNLAELVSETESDSALAVLELADVIAMAIGTLVPLPEALERSILREPTRWITALRRQVRHERNEDASAAASLIARFGSAEDVAVLRHFDRTSEGRSKRRGLATRLIRRVSPTVRVHDLGLASLEIGARVVALTATRRKSAALLLYMVTRPELMATRELVMESLWPDQNPKSAMNSLHQTLVLPSERARALVRRRIERRLRACGIGPGLPRPGTVPDRQRGVRSTDHGYPEHGHGSGARTRDASSVQGQLCTGVRVRGVDGGLAHTPSWVVPATGARNIVRTDRRGALRRGRRGSLTGRCPGSDGLRPPRNAHRMPRVHRRDRCRTRPLPQPGRITRTRPWTPSKVIRGDP